MTPETNSQELSKTNKEELDLSQGEPTFEGRHFSFAADIVETDEAVTVIADLPGVSADKLDIDLRDSVLTIIGRVDDLPNDWKTLHDEYEIGRYMRKFNVSSAIDQERINATVRDGVLTLVLNKADRLRPRKIEVTTV